MSVRRNCESWKKIGKPRKLLKEENIIARDFDCLATVISGKGENYSNNGFQMHEGWIRILTLL